MDRRLEKHYLKKLTGFGEHYWKQGWKSLLLGALYQFGIRTAQVWELAGKRPFYNVQAKPDNTSTAERPAWQAHSEVWGVGLQVYSW